MSTSFLLKTRRGFVAVPTEAEEDAKMLKLAIHVERFSPLHTKVGAILESFGILGIIGNNKSTQDGLVHAEIDALEMYRRLKELGLPDSEAGLSPTMYVTWIPCLACAQEIIAAGIKRVVGINRLLPIEKQAEYNTKYKLNEALELLRGSGVEVTLYDEQSGWMQSESVTVLTPKSND